MTNLPSVASNSNKSSARIDGSSSQSASNIPQSNNTVKSSTSVKHSIEENNNKIWREHLEENYEATDTRTYMPDNITDNILIERRAPKSIEFTDDDAVESILNFLNYKKDNT